MSKDFKTTAAAGAARFITPPEPIETPPRDKEQQPEFYRINLKLDGCLKQYLSDEAWLNRLTITALCNQILLDYMAEHPHDNI